MHNTNNPTLSLFTAGRKVFREFLRSEYSEENMLFWLACEELKQEQSSEGVEEKARLIYEDYISILSPKEVNVKLNYIIIMYHVLSVHIQSFLSSHLIYTIFNGRNKCV